MPRMTWKRVTPIKIKKRAKSRYPKAKTKGAKSRGSMPIARLLQVRLNIFIMEMRLLKIFPSGRKKKETYSIALIIPIYVELAPRRRAKSVTILPAKKAQERALKILKTL